MVRIVESGRSNRPAACSRGGRLVGGAVAGSVRVEHRAPTSVRARPAAQARRRGAALRAGLLAAALAGALAACGPQEPQPEVDTLRASFVAQIGSIDLVTDLEVDGDELRFVRPDGSGQGIEWRVRIDSLEVDPGSDEGAQPVGHVLSTWTANGRPITVRQGPAGPVTDMPHWVLDAGLAPECWALWNEETGEWGW